MALTLASLHRHRHTSLILCCYGDLQPASTSNRSFAICVHLSIMFAVQLHYYFEYYFQFYILSLTEVIHEVSGHGSYLFL
jgi:hypothetical protein